MTLQDFNTEIEDLKIKGNKRLQDFTVRFTENKMYLSGKICHTNGKPFGNGEIYRNVYMGELASFFIPTAKGYMSAKWKKTKFYKMNSVVVTDELLKELAPYLQSEKPKTFIRNTGNGWGVAGVVANHINKNGSDPYCNQ
tara:strand:- start:42 stop:461 length:420 start_codon:yes stop_codon:yes gene_type:complete